MPHSAHIELPCANPKVAASAAAALAVEARDGPEGATLTVHAKGALVLLTLQGHDVATLRAAVNSAVRLAQVAIQSASV